MPALTAQPPSALVVTDWGRTRYADALRRQGELVARRNAGEAPDTLVFTEHEPVYTLGVRPGADRHLLWEAAELARRGIEVQPTTRGGDITYHGPGQVVGYPIVHLAPRKDLHAWLRLLEDVMIAAVARFDLAAGRNPGLTGIWIGRRKIAAIGVAVKKWTAFHGFALNVSTDLSPFAGIVPCGITAADGTVTSLEAELGRPVELAAVKSALADEFRRRLPGYFANR